MSDVLLYKRVVALNGQTHAALRIRPIVKYGFAAGVNSLPVLAGEFNECSRHYPIMFAKMPSGSIVPLAMLGLREHENLFVGRDGRWDARYIPAYARRYPFVAGRGEQDDLVVCIDEEAHCLNTTEGEPLFVNGAPGAALQHAIRFVEEFQGAVPLTEKLCQRIDELGLMRDAESVVKLNDGTELRLGGLRMVDEEKLRGADAAVQSELFTSGALQMIYLHLHSLGNLALLVDRLSSRMAAAKKH